MSKKHDRNVRYLARAMAFFYVAQQALHQCGVSISQLEIGPSSSHASGAYDNANHRMRDLEQRLGEVEKLVCS